MANIMTQNSENSPLAVLNNQNTPLKIQEALNIMLANEDSGISALPFRPKGGQVFVFKPLDSNSKDDWKADGHIWSNEGTRTLKFHDFTIHKRHFKLFLGYEGKKRKIENGFKKMVYHFESDDVALIHYLGNESLSIQRAHGNSKKAGKVFVRTQPSVLEYLKRKVAASSENPHKMYKEIVSCGKLKLCLFMLDINCNNN